MDNKQHGPGDAAKNLGKVPELALDGSFNLADAPLR